MAISPKEAKKLSRPQIFDLERFENEIDEGLPRGKTCFYSVILHDVKIANELIRRYESVGWDVKFYPSSFKATPGNIQITEKSENGNQAR